MIRLNSQVIIAGGCALILHENLATEPCVTTSDIGWTVNEEIPTKQNITINILYFCCQTEINAF